MASGSDGGLVTFTVSVAGTAIPTSLLVDSIDIEQRANRIARASLVIADGDAASQDFAASSAATFLPGSTITIELGYDSTNQLVFSGIITGQSLSLSNAGSSLRVDCRDPAVIMTVGRKTNVTAKAKDSDAISTIVSAAGLSATVPATSVEVESLVQYDCTDWDFIVTRAEVNGLLVLTQNGKVNVIDPTNQPSASVTLTHGIDLFGFEGDLDAVGQLDTVNANAWDPATTALITATNSGVSMTSPGNLTTKALAGKMNQGAVTLQTTGAETKDALTQWAKAQAVKSVLAKIVATATVQGRSDLSPSQTVTLAGLGDRFNGTHLITGIRHRVRGGNWISDLYLGHERQWFHEEFAVTTPPAAGLLPGIQGLSTGTVVKIDSDPDNGFRVQVSLSLANDSSMAIWARLAQFHATSGAGAFFFPEVGDEVLIGFLNADPRFPVVLGSLYSKGRTPDSTLTPDADNSHKALYTKAGLFVDFNDKDKILTLSTPGGNKLVLDDKNGQIQLIDQNNNSLAMTSDGITLKSAADLTAEAAKAMTLKGPSGVTADAGSGDATVKGNNLSLTASMQLTAKGSTTAEVQGGAQLTLKGGMVMIN